MSKKSSHTGYHWRDNLINELLPCVKQGIDELDLRNIVHGYVPHFFIVDLPKSSGAYWLSTHPLYPKDDWWKKEIEDIGNDFARESGNLDDSLAKSIMEKHGWEVEEPVEGISISDNRGRWRYDGFKDKIAIEVELSSRSQVFKDAFKFLIGQALSQIDVGVVMVRERLEGKGKPYLGSVRRDWHPIYTSLPMLRIAFYGFHKTT